MKPSKIAVLGLWHQGLVAAACLADLGYEVAASDPSADVVSGLSTGRLPIYEPGLDELVAKGVASGALSFKNSLVDAVRDAEVVCIMFDTPVDSNDVSDLSAIFAATREIASSISPGAIVYVTSQVRVGTSTQLLQTLVDSGAQGVTIAYSPENLQLGKAIERYRHPALPVIGTDDPLTFQRLSELLSPVSNSWRHTDLATAEMLKHALNGFLGVSICFANELGNLCDAIGADGARIAELLRLEPRVGSKAMLMPGLGFSGGTLARDMTTLRSIGKEHGVETQVLDGAWQANKYQNGLVARHLRNLLSGLNGRRICVLGLTYKPGTSTLRRSAALDLIGELAGEGAVLRAHDPRADRAEIGALSGFTFYEDPYDAAAGADAIVLMTPWDDYRELDLERLRRSMRGSIMIDTARLWHPGASSQAGFTYLDIGSGRIARNNSKRIIAR